ncbi:MAG: hypothetical protein JXQ75_09235 [Phycisphaerae bacterium]|nr:hypothetical protein [Phycisphaerae bacterium]
MFRIGVSGPSVAVVLMAGGLMFGLFGWRLVRCLAVLDALVVAVLSGFVLRDLDFLPGVGVPTWAVGAFLAVGLSWIAWRFPNWAAVAMSGAVGFLLPQMLLDSGAVPLLVRVLVGALACGLAMALHLALRNEAAVVVTGLHGGWLCLAALVAVAADPGGFGGQFLELLASYTLLLPLVGMVFSAILIALQWADMERTVNPTGIV